MSRRDLISFGIISTSFAYCRGGLVTSLKGKCSNELPEAKGRSVKTGASYCHGGICSERQEGEVESRFRDDEGTKLVQICQRQSDLHFEDSEDNTNDGGLGYVCVKARGVPDRRGGGVLRLDLEGQ